MEPEAFELTLSDHIRTIHPQKDGRARPQKGETTQEHFQRVTRTQVIATTVRTIVTLLLRCFGLSNQFWICYIIDPYNNHVT